MPSVGIQDTVQPPSTTNRSEMRQRSPSRARKGSANGADTEPPIEDDIFTFYCWSEPTAAPQDSKTIRKARATMRKELKDNPIHKALANMEVV
mmetsp:Transcript_14316/g.29677  ORF Transcript_14316/g.29677 Transcript_14316/m.29677 type:complete len:93 (+) Transcript_14316:2-280(+)